MSSIRPTAPAARHSEPDAQRRAAWPPTTHRDPCWSCVSASATIRSSNTLQVGMSSISPTLWPQLHLCSARARRHDRRARCSNAVSSPPPLATPAAPTEFSLRGLWGSWGGCAWGPRATENSRLLLIRMRQNRRYIADVWVGNVSSRVPE